MGRKKSKFGVIRGKRKDSIFLVRTHARCTAPSGVGELCERYLIPILFQESEYDELSQPPLDEAETRIFRHHLLTCLACASIVYNIRRMVEAEQDETRILARKRALKAQLKLVR